MKEDPFLKACKKTFSTSKALADHLKTCKAAKSIKDVYDKALDDLLNPPNNPK